MRYTILLLLPLFIFAGCATYKPQTVNVKPIDHYKNRVDYAGLSIAIDPFDTPEKAESAFYVDLTTENIKPLHVIINNNSLNTYLIHRQSIYVSSDSGSDLQPVNSNYVFSKFEHNALLHAVLGFGIFSYMKAEDANEKMKGDWYSKELPDEMTITKRRKISGFVFFETTSKLQGKKIHIPVIDLKNDSEELLEIQIQ